MAGKISIDMIPQFAILPESNSHKLEVKDVYMAFTVSGPSANEVVLSDVSFSVKNGSFLSILGPSGCGKTTLIKIIAGLLTPNRGVVKMDGKSITGPSQDRTVIFQDYGLFEWKTVVENVEFGLKARGVPKLERLEIVQRYISLVNLCGSEHKYPNELSGGMKQRAAIARALAVNPECLLMDEPFAALDSQTRLNLQEDILYILEQTRKTIVMVTHNIEEAVFLSDRIIVLSNTPTYIALDMEIDLPRPRSAELRFNSHFLELANRIWETLRSQVTSDSYQKSKRR